MLILTCGKEKVFDQDRLVKKGAIVFQTHCSSCHGEWKKGDGPLSTTLNEQPANLNHFEGTSSDRIIRIVVNGVPDSTMKGYKDILTKDEISAVVAYLIKTN